MTLDAQLAAQETISWSTALKGHGKNFLDEQRRIVDEKKQIMDLQKEMEQKGQLAGMLPNVTMSQNPAATGVLPPPPQQPGMGSMMPPGGGMQGGMPMSPQAQGMMGAMQAGMPPSDYDKMSPQDVMSVADAYAQQAVAAGPNRRSALSQMRKELPETIYSQVKERVRQMDQQAKQEGKAMIQQGGGPPM
jgi:hypothetical protein